MCVFVQVSLYSVFLKFRRNSRFLTLCLLRFADNGKLAAKVPEEPFRRYVADVIFPGGLCNYWAAAIYGAAQVPLHYKTRGGFRAYGMVG